MAAAEQRVHDGDVYLSGAGELLAQAERC